MWRTGLAFLLGHCCVHALPRLPEYPSSLPTLLATLLATWLVWALLLSLALVLAARMRWRVVIAVLLGVAWAGLNASIRIEGDLPTRLEGQSLQVAGYVASLPQENATSAQFVLDVVEAPPGVPPRIRLAWYLRGDRRVTLPRAGELWQLTVRLKRRNGFANPGGFDYEGYLFRDGIGASGYVRDDPGNR